MIGILGLIFVIVAPIFIYRSAKQNGRNALGWTLAALAVGLGVQIVLPAITVIIIGIAMLVAGRPPNSIDQPMMTAANISALICLVLSVVGVLLMMRQVAKIPEEKPFAAPPSPPEF
jgi:hypothetical protein